MWQNGHDVSPSKESEGPYAWRYMLGHTRTICKLHMDDLATPSMQVQPMHDRLTPSRVSPTSSDDDSLQTNEMDFEARLRGLQHEASHVGAISFRLPKLGASAGLALDHATKVLESIFAKHEPLIFKIGFTHCPTWRWCNQIYGYQHAMDRWAEMCVFFADDNPHGPSMMEAAMIQRFQGT